MQNSRVGSASSFTHASPNGTGAAHGTGDGAQTREEAHADSASSLHQDEIQTDAPPAHSLIRVADELPDEAEVVRAVFAAAGPSVSSFIRANFEGNINEETMLAMARHRFLNVLGADERNAFKNGFRRLAALPFHDDDIMYAFSTPAAPENAKAFFQEVFEHLHEITDFSRPVNPYEM